LQKKEELIPYLQKKEEPIPYLQKREELKNGTKQEYKNHIIQNTPFTLTSDSD